MGPHAVETLVGGSWIGSDEWVEVGNPADARVPVAAVPALSSAQVSAAYDSAEAGFEAWRRASAFERAEVLVRAAGLLRERLDEVAADIVAENGKTIAEARIEVIKSAEFLEYYAALARQPYGTLLNDARPGTTASVRREPVGIVLAITPWNDPLLTPARKLAPALMCGNSGVLKPASETPLSGLHLARALHDAGLPAGALNVITGRSQDVAAALVADERIAAVSFTGGNEVGDRLRVEFAARNLRYQAEMGGKNASVILADADLDLAAAGVVAAAFGGCGQRCTATSRVIVDRSVADAYVARFTERVESLRVGPGIDAETNMGPLVSAIHLSTVMGFISRASQQGAQVVTGGIRPDDESRRHGHFLLPTLLADVTPEMEIWRAEVFGPVVVMREVDGLDEAIAATNDSDFGLSAAVFTAGLASAQRFIDEVECGQVAVNTSTAGWDVHFPFGGFRQSGSPFKEQGDEAVRFYTRVKTVAVHIPSSIERP